VITLRAGAAEAVLLPEAGAAFARLAHDGRDLLVPIPEGGAPNRGFHGAFVMAPWTNRLDGGRIVVDGVEHRMPVNRPEEGNALHGFLREMAWSVIEADGASATLECRFDRAPFVGRARLAMTLGPDRLTLSLSLTNDAAVPTPMGFGWHPFFPRPDGTRLRFSARTVFGRDARNLPVAPRPTAGINGSFPALLGLDTHLAGWDGAAEIGWPDGRVLTLCAEGDWRSNVQTFSPRDSSVLCVEPVSHAPDAPNRPAAAAHGAMHRVAPGGMISGSLMIHWR